MYINVLERPKVMTILFVNVIVKNDYLTVIFSMSKSYLLTFAAAVCMLFTSCFKDEPLNAECDIEEAYLHADNPGNVFFQLSDSLVKVTSAMHTVNFSPLRPGSDLTRLAPCFRLTPGAKISPENGSVHDFSNGPVEYTVTSEDGAWNRKYLVYIKAMPQSEPGEMEEGTLCYDFEQCSLEPVKGKYYMWSDFDDENNWATGNPGFSIARPSAKPDEYPTSPIADGYDGKGVKLTTCSTGDLGAMMQMRLAAGNLFTGIFDAQAAVMGVSGALKATHFGDGAKNKINVRPLRISGWYQYTPGETFQNKAGKPIEGRIDEGDIYAIVYKNTDQNGNAVYLDGSNVLTSDLIVAKALSGHVGKTEGGWKQFDIEFDYIKDMDLARLANYGYSLTLVFTSSCKGDVFEGAIGSTLLVDKVRVDYERPKYNK